MATNLNMYSINLVVQNEKFASIKDQVICPSCKELKLNAKITNCYNNCQVSLCERCARTTYRCPKCSGTPIWNDCLIIRQLIANLDFKCEICKAIVHFDDVYDHYKTHSSNRVVTSGAYNQPTSNDRVRDDEVVSIRRPTNDRNSRTSENNSNNNDSEKCNCCDCLKKDNFSKLINFYYIIFYLETFAVYITHLGLINMFVFTILSLIAAGESNDKGPEKIFCSLVIVFLGIDIITIIVIIFKKDIDKNVVAWVIKICNCWAYVFFFFVLVYGFIEDSMKITFGNGIGILLLVIFETTGLISFLIYIYTFTFMCRHEITDDDYFNIIYDIFTEK